jgi:hypothetical protein
VKLTVHAVSGDDPAVMFSPIWNPLPQSLTTEYVAVHAAAAFAAGAAAIAASPAQPSVNAATVETTTRALPFPGEPRHRGALNLIRFPPLSGTATVGRGRRRVQEEHVLRERTPPSTWTNAFESAARTGNLHAWRTGGEPLSARSAELVRILFPIRKRLSESIDFA